MTTHASSAGRRAAEWVYQGVWGVLAGLFKVPQEPPSLPVAPGDDLLVFQPSDGYLRYLKFYFWLALVAIDLAILFLWLLIAVAVPWLGILLAIPAFLLAVVPDILAYIAIHLRFDTTWYLMTERSLRIRRGIMEIAEVTITFENVQNVHITQGPLQRIFGISNVLVETAGGGSGAASPERGSTGHQGVIEGVDNAADIRDRVMARVRSSQSAGLGDEADRDGDPTASGVAIGRRTATQVWTTAHLTALRGIRDEAKRLAEGTT
ncbi:MAG: PH domain-containing protein [Phycisphaerales bacterium]|nr:PH domain-containing protein [Phycisphaerales bacterium]